MDVDELKNDNLSGALEICVKAAGILQQEIEKIDRAFGDGLQSQLLDLGIKIIISQPRMAPLYNLVNKILLACEKSDDQEIARISHGSKKR
jgi:translation initiation factor 2B subunit (eIF-2B alpha/beta/delta family)